MADSEVSVSASVAQPPTSNDRVLFRNCSNPFGLLAGKNAIVRCPTPQQANIVRVLARLAGHVDRSDSSARKTFRTTSPFLNQGARHDQ
jgi:hypothetical protein